MSLFILESRLEYLTSKFTFFLLVPIAIAGATVFSFNHIPKFSSFFKPNENNMNSDDIPCVEHGHHSLEALRSIIEPSSHNNSYINASLHERALPNARLVRALGLTNTFVSASPEVHHKFVRRALGMLHRAKRRGWGWIAQVAKGAVGSATQLVPNGSDEEHIIKFDSLIQNTTLLVVLVVLMGQDEALFEPDFNSSSSLTTSDIECVAKNITLLWGLSKLPDAIPPSILEDLNEALGRLMGRRRWGDECNGEDDKGKDGDLEGFDNPLDFVVPAWETLWRVVATTVAYAYAYEDDESANVKEALIAFAKDPTEARFRQASDADADETSPLLNLDVRCIVAECMRLHPPSKHIGRSKVRTWWAFILRFFPAGWMQYAWSMPHFTRVKVNARVGELLRCQRIWGADAASFMPRRHLPNRATKEQNEAMGWVFGNGKLRCVAATWAPMAAGVVAGAVVGRIEREGIEVVKGSGGIGGRGGWEGWWVVRKG